MSVSLRQSRCLCAHPLHAVLIASATPLFLGALLSDLAYASSQHVQWANFASWLLVGAMVLTGLALVWTLVFLLWPAGRTGRPLLLLGLLAATFVIGFIDALLHTRDAWAMMPGGLIASVMVALTAVAATWAAFAPVRDEDTAGENLRGEHVQ